MPIEKKPIPKKGKEKLQKPASRFSFSNEDFLQPDEELVRLPPPEEK